MLHLRRKKKKMATAFGRLEAEVRQKTPPLLSPPTHTHTHTRHQSKANTPRTANMDCPQHLHEPTSATQVRKLQRENLSISADLAARQRQERQRYLVMSGSLANATAVGA